MNTLCFVPDSSGIDSRFPETQMEDNGDRNMEGWALFWTIETKLSLTFTALGRQLLSRATYRNAFKVPKWIRWYWHTRTLRLRTQSSVGRKCSKKCTNKWVFRCLFTTDSVSGVPESTPHTITAQLLAYYLKLLLLFIVLQFITINNLTYLSFLIFITICSFGYYLKLILM